MQYDNIIVKYKQYIREQLKKVPVVDYPLAAYDTGNGLTIGHDMGDSIHMMDTLSIRLVHIKEPRTAVGAEGDFAWDTCWLAGKRVIYDFLNERNDGYDWKRL